MKLALSTIGILLFASSTQFSPEAIKSDPWHDATPKILRTSMGDDAAAKILPIVNPVSTADIEEQLAELRKPDGPPPAREEVTIDTICDSLAAAAEAHGLPTGFFARLIWQESRFKPRAVSPAGAQGVAQFMPAVAVERGLSDPFDPIEALPESAAFLKDHVNYFGNLGLAAAAYNGGARRVTDWLARRGKLPEETRNYVKIITGHEPEKWIDSKEITLAVDLPRNAPCDGVADLSRNAEATTVSAQLEPPMARLVAQARIAAAKAGEARRVAAAAGKAKRARLLAKGKGGRNKPAVQVAAKTRKLPTKIAGRSNGKRGYKLADTSAARR